MSVSSNKKKEIWQRDKYICQYCKRNLEDEYFYHYPSDNCQITIDHIIPQWKGGHNSDNNLITSCKTCNQLKGKREEPIKKLLHSR